MSSNLFQEGKLWGKIPEGWIQWDIHLQNKISSLVSQNSEIWQKIENLTENPLGMTLLGILVISFVLYVQKKYLKNSWRSKKTLLFILFLGVGVGVNDFFSNQLKHLFGRAKPFVQDVSPGSRFPLSFPSNHASNTAFLMMAIFFLLLYKRNEIPNRLKTFYVIVSSLFVLVIAFSRVFFGEHFPLDVLCGMAWGTFLAYHYSKSCRQIDL